MTMRADPDFSGLVADSLANERLGESLGVLEVSRSLHYKLAFDELDDGDALKRAATEVRQRSLKNLRPYLEEFEQNVQSMGGQVHWAMDGDAANQIIADICRAQEARRVTKSKSMVTEEIALLPALEAAGIEVTETDLGEYIIQLRDEPPSHITAPALHLSLEQVIDAFNSSHALDRSKPLETADDLLAEARGVLRDKFLQSDVGITGANFLIAESGGAVVVTNEGNADLTAIIPDTHIVVTGIEKVVASFEDVGTLLRVLPRAAVGQRLTNYTSFFHGPARDEDTDGPREFHVVLVDNGRSEMFGTDFEDMLRCIRCGACINHCPVYTTIGGHAYGSVYPGPMGAVLTPQFASLQAGRHLPNASTFCGRCEEVCPVGIPLPRLLRQWRSKELESGYRPLAERSGLNLWKWLNRRGWSYRLGQKFAAIGLRGLAKLQTGGKHISRLPFLAGWTRSRNLTSPAARSFQSQWADRPRKGAD